MIQKIRVWLRISIVICITGPMGLHLIVTAQVKTDQEFPHSSHVEVLACTDCHLYSKTGHKMGSPDQETCLDCHDQSPDLDFTKKVYPPQGITVLFSHKIHKTEKCSICHGDLNQSPPIKPVQNDCFQCHTKKHRKLDCVSCHEQKLIRPAYHDKVWLRKHGLSEFDHYSTRHGWDCAACHGQDVCASCHQIQRPTGHTSFFRIRGHGLQAEMDRASCVTCHQESYCIRCHKETKPLNHKGQWSFTHGFSIPGGKRDLLEIVDCVTPQPGVQPATLKVEREDENKNTA